VIDLERVLETERLRLEPLQVRHAAALFPVLSDPGLYEFIPQLPPASQRALEERYRYLERRASPDGREVWLNWALIPRDGIAGCLGTVQATLQEGGRSLFAYELGRAFWGRGYATEACSRVLAFLFEDAGVRLVVARVDTRNRASIRLLERLGFDRTGFHPKADNFKGADSDEHEYALASSGAGPPR
jgi:ribosomal-protein-alanine N-acetyltransferase